MSSATIEKYRQWLEGRYAPETQRHYEHVAARALQHGSERLNPTSGRAYLDEVARTGGARTVRLHRSALANFASFLNLDLGLDRFRPPRLPHRLPQYLNDGQLTRYLDLVRRRVGSERTRTILLLLPLVGLRISEICTLKLSNVSHRGSDWSLRVVGKGNKERIVPLNSLARRILSDYLRDSFISGPALFGVTPAAVRERMRGIRKELGLGWLTPHKLRHTFASSLARRDVHMKKIAQLLGHRSITTAAIYTHVEDDSCREAVERMLTP